jgi:uncharacterized protein with GYD domain
MSAYIILTKFAPGAFGSPAEFKRVSADLSARLKRECPGVHWKTSYGTLGRYDVVDLVEADDAADVHRAAVLINTVAHANTETMMATPWDEFLAKM